jgi:hypothetical protein
MKPEADRVLRQLAQALVAELAPALPADYEQKSAFLMAMLLSAAAEEWDRAVARRVEENAALRALFAAAASELGDPGLRERLLAAASGAGPGLLVSELERENGALRALLIELHAHLETLETPAARRLEDAIFEELRRSTERRRLSMQPF